MRKVIVFLLEYFVGKLWVQEEGYMVDEMYNMATIDIIVPIFRKIFWYVVKAKVKWLISIEFHEFFWCGQTQAI